MIKGKKVLALIPARGGSKGIKNKNIIELCGKPLIYYSIEAAQKSQYVDSIVVSTDSEKIANVARAYGARVPFFRPAELADDYSRTIDAVMHAIKELADSFNEQYDILLLLQPTQPLRNESDIDSALEIFIDNGCKGTVGVSEVTDSPVLIRTVGGSGFLEPIIHESSTIRRQDMPKYYRVNGTVYVNAISEICSQTSFNDNPVPCFIKRSHSIDIDEPIDIIFAESMLRARK